MKTACPMCEASLEIEDGSTANWAKCPSCSFEFRPPWVKAERPPVIGRIAGPESALSTAGIEDHVDTTLTELSSALAPLLHQEARLVRQQLREYRTSIHDAFEDELQHLLIGFGNLEKHAAGSPLAQITEAFCNATEEELEARVNESSWDHTKRVARRGAKATKAWLQTPEGKEAATVAGIIAAALGFSLWG